MSKQIKKQAQKSSGDRAVVRMAWNKFVNHRCSFMQKAQPITSNDMLEVQKIKEEFEQGQEMAKLEDNLEVAQLKDKDGYEVLAFMTTSFHSQVGKPWKYSMTEKSLKMPVVHHFKSSSELVKVENVALENALEFALPKENYVCGQLVQFDTKSRHFLQLGSTSESIMHALCLVIYIQISQSRLGHGSLQRVRHHEQLSYHSIM